VIGRPVSQEEFDVYFRWGGRAAGSELIERAHLLVRRVLLAFMNLAIPALGEPAATPLTRSEVI